MRSLAFAIRTLTRLRIGEGTLESQERSLFWFPLVGSIYGLLSVLIACLPFSAALRAALIIAASAYLSRGFHLDGLADFADGLGGGWTAERALAIMRDSHIGAFGTLALIIVLLVDHASLVSVVTEPALLFFAPIAARLMIVLASSVMPYAREGEGSASHLVRGAKPRHLVGPCAQVLLLVGLCWHYISKQLAVRASLGLLCALAATVVVMGVSKRRLGGVTGDVLGAVATIAECAALIGFLIPLA